MTTINRPVDLRHRDGLLHANSKLQAIAVSNKFIFIGFDLRTEEMIKEQKRL